MTLALVYLLVFAFFRNATPSNYEFKLTALPTIIPALWNGELVSPPSEDLRSLLLAFLRDALFLRPLLATLTRLGAKALVFMYEFRTSLFE